MAPDHDGEANTATCCKHLLEALLATQFVQDALKSAGLDAAVMRWQVGTAAVYLTVSDHSVLETARFALLETAGAALAYRLRVFGKRLSYLKKLAAIRTIQRVARGRQGRKIARKQRKFLRAVISLQRHLRNKAYINDALAGLRRLIGALLTIQKVARRFCARRMIKRLKAARDQYLNSSGNLITAKELRLARRRGEVSEVSMVIPPVKSKMKDYRSSESALILEIQSMIHGTKVSNHDALVKFDVKETRKVLTEWANSAASPTLKAQLLKVAGRVEVAYRLLKPETLIPIVKVGCLSLFQSTAQRRRHSAKHADKKVTKEHEVFRGIVKVQGVIEELLRVAFNERKEALNRIDTIKKDLVRNIRKFGPEFSRSKATPFYAEIQHTKDFIIIADNIMRFGLVLYKYYQNYVLVMVEEFGEKSTYRRNFNDDDVYLLTLQQLMEGASGPLHYSGKAVTTI
jgi:myosin heavy subunit